jgi:CRP/FNR family transcriptional regulator, cyclic AMP receptor protein
MRMAKIKPLKECELFRSLEDREIGLLAKAVEEKTLAANTPLFYENMVGEAMYLVASGGIQLSKMLAEGEVKTLTTLGPGAYFGEMALLETGPRPVSAIATADSVVLVLRRSEFQKLTAEQPQIAMKIIIRMYQTLSGRLRQASPRIQQLILERPAA